MGSTNSVLKQISLREFIILVAVVALGMVAYTERSRWNSEFKRRQETQSRLDRVKPFTRISIDKPHDGRNRTYGINSTQIVITGSVLLPWGGHQLENADTSIHLQMIETKTENVVAEDNMPIVLTDDENNGFAFRIPILNRFRPGLHLLYITLLKDEVELAQEIATLRIVEPMKR